MFVIPILYNIIVRPIPTLKLGAVAVNVGLARKFVFNQIVEECLIRNNYDRYRDRIYLAVNATLFPVGVFIWVNSSFALAHGVLIGFGLLVKILHIAYKRFIIKNYHPINPDEQVVYKDVINMIASYSTSSMIDTMGIKLAGYPIESTYIKEAIATSSKEDMQEFAKHLKLTHLNDRELFKQQIHIFFSCASKQDQNRLYQYFNFLEDLDMPTDAELGANLLRALPDDITEFFCFPHAKNEDLSLVLRRCTKLKRSEI